MAAPSTPGSNSGETPREHGILTVIEVAAELRCSKAHVHHLITGKVPGVRPLPSLWLGRRRLILRASFEVWLRDSEKHSRQML
jgi:Helix-turn-helix domain